MDIAANRNAREDPAGEMVARIRWSLSRPLFCLSPCVAFCRRSFLLQRFGTRIDRQVHAGPSVEIEFLWQFTIGDRSGVGAGTRIRLTAPSP
jgi:hypothetical protein